MAWADSNTNGSASGNFKYDFTTNNIALSGLMTGNGVVSNTIPVQGTGSTVPVSPIQGEFTAGTIGQPGLPGILTTNGLTFRLVISQDNTGSDTCAVTISMQATLVLQTGGGQVGGGQEPAPSEVLQAPQLAQFSRAVQTFIPRVIKRPGAPGRGSPPVTPNATAGIESPATGGNVGDNLYLLPVNKGGVVSALAAGDDLLFPVGLWMTYQTSRFSDAFAATASDSDSDTIFAGADFSPWDGVLVGVALGYERTETETQAGGGQQDLDGFSVIPYFGMVVDGTGFDVDLSTDLAFGYSSLGLEQFRIDVNTGTRINSDTDAFRAFVSWNVSAAQAYGNWYVGTRAGVLVAKDTQSAFTESDGTRVSESTATLGRVTIGIDASYLWDDLEPFGNLLYEYDYQLTQIQVVGTPHPNDRDDFLLGLGLRWYSDYGFTSSFEYTTVLGREQFNADSYSFNIRWDF